MEEQLEGMCQIRCIAKKVQVQYRTLSFDIDLVAENDEREVLRVARRRLDEELLSPWLQVLETLRGVHIVHKHTAVSTTVERNAERLETFLTGSIPDLW